MKKIAVIILTLLFGQATFGQVAGNVNYQTRVNYPDNNINISRPSNYTLISVKGLANIKADSYVAIFSITQTAKTANEVNKLMDERISNALKSLKQFGQVEIYVDMISFVPIYEYQVDKKIFRKDNYTEVPKGFELKKNIHIKYSDPQLLNKFIQILSNEQIYDLVRVDYFSSKIDSVKKELMNKAKTVLQEKIKNYESILGHPYTNVEKRINDGYKVVYPVERYKSYQAYNSSSLNLTKPANVNSTEKSTTLYYQPIVNKDFDFVINPVILEPVIQVMYEIKLGIIHEQKKTENNYFIITPNGELKPLNVK